MKAEGGGLAFRSIHTRLGIAGFLATVVLTTAAVLLTTASTDWIPNLIIGAWLCVFSAIAMLIVLRIPGNVVGVLMLLFTVAATLSLAAASYGQYVYEYGHRDLPLGEVAAWISLWLPLPAIGLLVLVFLRFPNGELLAERWRYVERLTILVLAAGAIGLAFRPGPVDAVRVSDSDGFGEASLPNPFGIESWDGLSATISNVGDPILGCLTLATIVSLVLRFRRAEGSQRRQMKSLVLAVALFPVFFFCGEAIGAIESTEEDVFSFLTIMAGAFLIPIAMGVAILKYRLYDIDLIINRALVYGALTALLVAAYVGLVFALQLVLEPLTEESDLAVAASTLAVAALFRPVRARVQTFIDRRFYRRKYDAAHVIERLTRSLRDEVEIDSVERDVMAAVRETVQPTHASLWVRTS